MSRSSAKKTAAGSASGTDAGPKRDLSKVRHDLRTPINQILGYCEMLQEDEHTPVSFQADLRKIHAGGRQLLALMMEYFDEEIFETRGRDRFQLCHELRTPVNHIIGYGEMLQEQAEELGRKRLLSDLKKITDAARRWLKLMEEQLLAPPSTATQELVPGPALRTPGAGVARSAPTPHLAAAPALNRLLVVDDDEANRNMLARRLRRQGFDVAVARSGLEALQMLRASPVDLVLLDVVMPHLDGCQVLAKLKADPGLARVPVIMISALDQEECVVQCIEAGAEDYIAKPVNPVFLRARLAASLERERLRRQERAFLRQIQQEKQRADDLLHIILPRGAVAELKLAGEVRPRRHENVGVIFCDIVGFAAYSDRRPPEEILPHLQKLVESFEQIAVRHGLEKIKTIGDSFMAVAGLPAPVSTPARACVLAGLEMIASTRDHVAGWQIRVGVNVGPVVAGIVGRLKYQFDIWGDTVNTAARVEHAGAPGAVCLPAAVWTSIAEEFPGQSQGRVSLKGKGDVELVLVRPRMHPPSQNP